MKKILVIDDDQIMRETIRDILHLEDYAVFQADGGRSGIRMIEENRYDVIITDILMPDIDGISVIINVKSFNPYLPILAISGGNNFPADYYLTKATNIGADSTIAKPFDIDELLNKVKNLLAVNPQKPLQKF